MKSADIPDKVLADQIAASNPDVSAWVTANDCPAMVKVMVRGAQVGFGLTV